MSKGVRKLCGPRGRFGRFVYASTTSVYGRDDGGWVDEDDPAEPTTESGPVVRADAERLVSQFGDAEQLLIRFSGLCGEGRIVHARPFERGEPIAAMPKNGST